MGQEEIGGQSSLRAIKPGDISGRDGGNNLEEQKNNSSSEKPKIKRPIFLATRESDIAKFIDESLFIVINGPDAKPFLNKEDYTLSVINAEIYEGLYKQYLFTLLGQDEQKRAQEVAINEQLQQKATAQAMQIDFFIKNTENYKDQVEYENDTRVFFNEGELRVILNKMKHSVGEKGKLSHQDTWNIMDLLVLQGFLVLENALEETRPREKRQWVLLITGEQRLDQLKKQREECFYLEEKYLKKRFELDKEIIELTEKIKNGKSGVDTSQSNGDCPEE